MSQIRLGLIGCGFVGRLHAQRLRDDPRAHLVVCCDPEPTAARAVATEYTHGAAIETDPIDAIGRHRLDGVVILLAHAAALSAGLHGL